MDFILLCVQTLLALAIIGVVLLQRSDSDGFGMGSGGMGLLSGRAKGNLLTRTTAILAVLFMFNSMLMTVLSTRSSPLSLLDKLEQSDGSLTVPVATDDDSTMKKKDASVPEDLQKDAYETIAPTSSKTQNPDVSTTTPKEVLPVVPLSE